MRMYKQIFKSIVLVALVSTGFAAYGIAQDKTAIINPETKAPIILETSPTGGEMNVALGDVIEITFSSDMDETSINGATLLLHATYTDTMHEEGREMMRDDIRRERSEITAPKNRLQHSTGVVDGTITYSNKVAVFTPNEDLSEGTMYTFTVTNGVKDVDNIPIQSDESWSFTTTGATDSTDYDEQNNSAWFGLEETEDSPKQAPLAKKEASSTTKTKVIDLGKAAHFVILAKNDVNNEAGSNITGHVGEGSMADSADKEAGAMNSEWTSDADQNLESQSSENDTASVDVTEALQNMMTAFTDTSMHNGNDVTTHNTESFHHNPELGPGVHEWDSLNITSEVTLSGSAEDVWIFKADKDLIVDENTVFTLSDGAQASNIFWYVEGEVTIGENAEFAGIILSMNDITLEEGAQLNGRMYSQMSINLNDNTITEPRNMAGQTTSTNE